MSAHNNYLRTELAHQRLREKDPVKKEAYALAARGGFDWFDTESAARRMAERAAYEITVLSKAVNDSIKLIEELEKHLSYCAWGDRWERECSETLRDSLPARLNEISTAELRSKAGPK